MKLKNLRAGDLVLLDQDNATYLVKVTQIDVSANFIRGNYALYLYANKTCRSPREYLLDTLKDYSIGLFSRATNIRRSRMKIT